MSGDTSYNGIIDLMTEYDDHIDIIDYKLKSVISFINYLNNMAAYFSF